MSINCLHCGRVGESIFELVRQCNAAGMACRAPIRNTPVQDRIETQSTEFRACNELGEHMARIRVTPIVDDDYPQVRHGYESALRAFLRACKANGRTMT